MNGLPCTINKKPSHVSIWRPDMDPSWVQTPLFQSKHPQAAGPVTWGQRFVIFGSSWPWESCSYMQLAVVTKVILWPDFLILDDCPYDIDSLIHMIIIRWWLLLLLLLYTLLFYDYPYLSTILSSSMIIIYAVLVLTPSINRLGCRWMLHAATTSPWTHPCLLTQCEHEQLRCHNVLKKWCT